MKYAATAFEVRVNLIIAIFLTDNDGLDTGYIAVMFFSSSKALALTMDLYRGQQKE